LKGSDNIDCEVENLLVKLGLDEKANSMACTLSGGMKRMLCLGMALIGDSNVSDLNVFFCRYPLEERTTDILRYLFHKFVKAFYFF
jgi:ABC-type transporter Mla maintaining outer membrane lipid asymmetry ATPase subunit MlaF